MSSKDDWGMYGIDGPGGFGMNFGIDENNGHDPIKGGGWEAEITLISNAVESPWDDLLLDENELPWDEFALELQSDPFRLIEEVMADLVPNTSKDNSHMSGVAGWGIYMDDSNKIDIFSDNLFSIEPFASNGSIFDPEGFRIDLDDLTNSLFEEHLEEYGDFLVHTYKNFEPINLEEEETETIDPWNQPGHGYYDGINKHRFTDSWNKAGHGYHDKVLTSQNRLDFWDQKGHGHSNRVNYIEVINVPAFERFLGFDFGANHVIVRDPVTGLQFTGTGGSLGKPLSGNERYPQEVINNNPVTRVALPNEMTGREFIIALEHSDVFDKGFYCPAVNDCQTQMQDAFRKMGVTYPGSPGGRFDWDEDFLKFLKHVRNTIHDLIDKL